MKIHEGEWCAIHFSYNLPIYLLESRLEDSVHIASVTNDKALHLFDFPKPAISDWWKQPITKLTTEITWGLLFVSADWVRE